MTNESIELFKRIAPLFFKGALVTVKVFLFASFLSFILGISFGILTCNRLKIPILSNAVEGIAFVTRAIPFFVQLLIVYFVIPDLLNINLEPFIASVIALGICSSGYVAQYTKGAINAVPIIHWEAAYTLGYNSRKTLWYIILPQTLRLMLPSMSNELDSLLKSTAIISSIGILELTRIGMNIVSREMNPVPIYLFLAILYLCMSGILNMITKNLEKKYSYVTN